jgi:hypothetical protein
MSIDVAAAPPSLAPVPAAVLPSAALPDASLPPGLQQRADGLYADPGASGAALAAAIDAVIRGGSYLAGLNYPVLLAALFGHGPGHEAAAAAGGARLADRIQPFAAARRALYRPVRIVDGSAAYVFEPVFVPDADGSERPGRLDADEFVADLWLKGIRFGIDVGAVRAAIAANRVEHVTVARHLAALPGQDARIVEVSSDIHRSDAPRQLANDRLDLNSFQNRFPQIAPGARLLQKLPASAGSPGVELSGAPILPTPGVDVDLAAYAGEGTAVENGREGEFLVARTPGFLQIDAATSRLSVVAKIVSRDGVSARTTGNLKLAGDYEEFGDVQEKRVVEGDSITVHGNVFGSVSSRGGTVLLHANLVGGSAENRRGDVQVRGVASGAVLRAREGAVLLERAENCIVSGRRVTIAHAVNCEIVGDEVMVGQAEGSAIAGRRVSVDACAPRKQGEMLVVVLQADGGRIGEVMAMVRQRVAQFGALAARQREAMQPLTAKPDVRRYLMLAARVRKGEISLNPEQTRQFQKMAQDVAPALQTIAGMSARAKALDAERQAGQAMLDSLDVQRREAAGVSKVSVASVQGETQVRVLGIDPAAGSLLDLAPREIRQRLRGPQRGELLFAGASGALEWSSDASETA